MPKNNTLTALPESEPPASAPAWLSIYDVAEQLQVHHSLVRRLIAQGKLPAAKIGGIYRLRQVDVDAFTADAMTTRRAAG